MKYNLKEMTSLEKPREKLMKYGAESLTDYELLAVIIKSGIKNKSVIDLSIEIMNYYNKIYFLNDATLNELKDIKGIGEAKALELLASIELGKRIVNGKNKIIYIKKAMDAYLYIKTEMINLNQEHFVCIYVDTKGKVICHRVISIGTNKETIADYKDAVKWALKYSSYGILYVHNHPSGDPNPSENDFILTDIFKNISKNVDLVYLDHIIIGKNCFYSFVKGKIEKE